VTVPAIGGAVVVLCIGQTAEILLATPTLGYLLGDYHPGPADQVKASFVAGPRHSDITVTCKNGVAVPKVEEH